MYTSKSYSAQSWDAMNPGLMGLGALGVPRQYDPTGANKDFKPIAADGANAQAECQLYQETGRLPSRLTAPPPIGSTPSKQEAYLAAQGSALAKFTASCGGGMSAKWPLILGGLALIGVAAGVLYTKKAALGF